MLTFLTGCDAGAKREYIMEALVKASEEGKKAFLLVPDQVSFERDRELLFRYGAQAANRVRVSGLLHFAMEVLEEKGVPGKPPADEAAEAVFMSLALRQTMDSLRIYAGHHRRRNNVQSLLAACNAFAQAGAEPETLNRISGLVTGRLREKTKELSLIYSAYKGLVTDRFSSANDNIRRASEALRTDRLFEGAVFYFDDFRGFTGVQTGLIGALLGQADVYVSLPGSDAGDPAQGPAFEHAAKNRRRLIRAANTAGVRIFTKEIPARPDALDAFRRRLFVPGAPQTDMDFPVTVILAQNKYDECEYVALQIKTLLEQEVCRAGEIAVYIRDESDRTSLVSALKKAAVPVFEDTRFPLSRSPLARLVLSAVHMAAAGFDTGEVLAYIKTDIAGIGDADCALLENYVYCWNIDGKRWERPFTENPKGFGVLFDDACKQTLEKINAIRDAVVAPVLELRALLAKEDAEESCRAVYMFLRNVRADGHFLEYASFLNEHGDPAGALACARVWDSLMEALDALADAAGGHGVSPLYFYELLSLMLSGTSLGDIPAGLDQVKIGMADRARYLSPKIVFAVGFQADRYPASRMAQSVFTGEDLRQLYARDLDLEALPEDVFEEEKLIVWQMLTCAAERIYISRSAFSVNGEKQEPSPFLRDIQRAAPGCTQRRTQSLGPAQRIFSPDSAFAVYADVIHDGGVFSASLKKALEESGLAGRLRALERAVQGVEDRFADPHEAQRLFGRDLFFSASRAETYAKCPFLFFCRYGMGVEPLTQAKLDVRINGLLVHKVLEDVLLRHAGERLADVPETALREEVRAAVDGYVSAFMRGEEQLAPSLVRSLARAERVILDILLRMQSEMNTCAFVTVGVEMQIGGRNADIPAYRLTLPDGGTLTMTGSIDRVDLMDAGDKKFARVVDYKTGGRDFKLGDVFDGLNMQMLLYLFALCENGKERFDALLPAGVLYVPANNAGTKLGRREDGEKIKLQKLKNGRMNGVILENADVIKGMESAAQGLYINAEIDKNGNLCGNLLTLEEFRLLHKKTDEILQKTGMLLHAGAVPALPMDTGTEKSVCDYCAFGAVCLKERGCEKRQGHKMSFDEARKRLHDDEDVNG